MRPSDSELIAKLSGSLEPTPALRRPRTLLALWLIASAIYLGIVIWNSTKHYPVLLGTHSWPSIVSWILLAVAFLVSSTGSIAAGIPGSRSVQRWLLASWALILGWAAWLVIRHFLEPSISDFAMRLPQREDLKCARATLFWGVGPLAGLYGILRALATVQPSRAGSLWWLSAFSASAFLIEIMCDDGSVFHQLYGHWLLVAVFGLLGYRAGRMLLRW